MSITLFSGCSFTKGDGFELSSDEPLLWVNLLHANNIHLKGTKLLNVGRGGRSNAGIFQDTVYHLLHHNVKYAFVAWTDMPRYDMSLGLELYETRTSFIPNSPMMPQRLNGITYTQEYLHKIRDRFTTLANLHYEICSLISYVNSLIKLAELTSTQIFFINSLCSWDHNYFTVLSNVLPKEYTEFTKNLINIDNRDDDEIFALYKKIHNEYKQLGGIQEQKWLNLYNSLKLQQIDVNNDNAHPGINSNQLYYKQLNQALQSKIGNYTMESAINSTKTLQS